MKATTLQEAQTFFLKNSSGGITCDAGIHLKKCYTYHEAVEFFTEIDRQKKELYDEKAKLLDKYGLFGGGQFVNSLHQHINVQLEALGVDPNS